MNAYVLLKDKQHKTPTIGVFFFLLCFRPLQGRKLKWKNLHKEAFAHVP